MSIEEDNARYRRAMGAVQCGIEFAPDKKDQTPKHLRVGVDSCAVSQAALAGLLIRKGIITYEEYVHELADEAEREAQRRANAIGIPDWRQMHAGLGGNS